MSSHRPSFTFHWRRHHRRKPSADTAAEHATFVDDVDGSALSSPNSPRVPSLPFAPRMSPPPLTIPSKGEVKFRAPVRDDWEWPPKPRLDVPELPPDTLYVERAMSLSSPSPSPSPSPKITTCEPPDATSPAAFLQPLEDITPPPSPVTACSPVTSSDAYRFGSPDAVGTALFSRKRRRANRLSRELANNPGLAVWHARRNAWTGAVDVRVSAPTQAGSLDVPPAAAGPTRETSPALATLRRLEVDALRAHSAESAAAPKSPALAGDTGEEKYPRTSLSGADDPSNPLQTTVTPLAPPILPPSHPARAGITPAAYLTIYARCVHDGVPPRVPVNLADMSRALVQGWQDEGEWPPRPSRAGLEPLAGTGRRKGRKREEGVEFVMDDELDALKREEKRLSGSGLVGRGMGKVKRALGIGESGGRGGEIEQEEGCG